MGRKEYKLTKKTELKKKIVNVLIYYLCSIPVSCSSVARAFVAWGKPLVSFPSPLQY